jgi:class 3 adenylate cyclase
MLDATDQFATSVLAAGDLNRVLATMLFTDVVNSTGELARLGDHGWLEILGDHDAAVRSALARFHGHEVKSTGDGFVAIFDRPGRAIHAAVAIVHSVAALGVTIRAGVHCGEIELVGDDIGGIAVHIAQRVCSVALPGVVLVTNTVKDLVDGSDIEFDDLGAHQLKGLPGARQLFAASI